MKIRDIRQYVRELCKNETLDLIGKDNEEWFKYVYGPNKKLDASITEAATFATNAEEQLFYEFVQNAFDAKADSLYFFFNENYLIVFKNIYFDDMKRLVKWGSFLIIAGLLTWLGFNIF